MITHELLRDLLQHDLEDIREMARYVPNEIVYKALIIREFMNEHHISDPREGIRRFHAYERVRLQRLGFHTRRPPKRDLAAKCAGAGVQS